ncbi:MAG: helix-hairpin-helix domain-containing protein [Slackia sp.]
MLFGLGIRHVGKTTGEQLAAAFPSMVALMEATEEQLAEVDGVGGVIAQSIRAFFANEDNREVIRRLERMGVVMEDAVAGEEVPQTLAGITFVLTGSLVESGMTRDEAGARLKAMGAKVSAAFPRKRDM